MQLVKNKKKNINLRTLERKEQAPDQYNAQRQGNPHRKEEGSSVMCKLLESALELAVHHKQGSHNETDGQHTIFEMLFGAKRLAVAVCCYPFLSTSRSHSKEDL